MVYENEDIRVQEVVSCLLCGIKGMPLYKGMRDRLFDAPGVWQFLRCPQCGLVWLNPRPVAEDIGEIYATYHTHIAEDRKPGLAWLKKKVEHTLLASSFGYDRFLNEQISRWLGRALGLFPPLRELVGSRIMWLDGRRKGKLLDVGCGNGRFLARMQGLGWDVMGVEPDAHAAKVAQDRFGIQVLIGTLEEVELPDNSFDAVTMSQAIEHVRDPIGLLKKCSRVLRPGGRLVVTTPNIESLGHKIFRESWRGLEPPRHLYVFSLQTLTICAEQADFQIRMSCTTAWPARWMWAASKLIQKNGDLPGDLPENLSWSLRLEGLAFQLLEHGLRVFRRNIGEGLILIASQE